MRIVMANNYFYLRGGAERYFFELGSLLRLKGHEVIPFSAYHEKNMETIYSQYFVNNSLLYSDCMIGKISLPQKIKTAINCVYSVEGRRKIYHLIKDTKPDIVHIHGIPFRLTSSIVDGIEDAGVPIVQTCHEYKTICPNQRFYNLSSEQVCEECKGSRYYKMLRTRCLKNSYVAGLIGCVEAYLCSIKKIYKEKINHFIAPSSFMRNKMMEFGVANEKVTHISNFVFKDEYFPSYNNKGYILYYGHFTPQKGLYTLLKSLKLLKNVSAKIVGEGYIGDHLRCLKDQYSLNNLEILDFLDGQRLKHLVRGASFTIVPSEWYENCPMTIQESFAMGKPVVGSNIGGIPELIEDGVNGFLFEPGNAYDLAEKIRCLLSKPELIVKMGKNARKKVEEEYNEEIHYQKLMEVYEKVIRNRRKL